MYKTTGRQVGLRGGGYGKGWKDSLPTQFKVSAAEDARSSKNFA
jgi:hypothetical protein